MPRGDTGAGSVLALGLVAVVLTLGIALAGIGAATVGRARAQGAADLAALAAADVLAVAAVFAGAVDAELACERAVAVAGANGGDIVSCAHEGAGVVAVRVAHSTAVGTATAAARAGPRSPEAQRTTAVSGASHGEVP